jgi:acetyltransferase
MLLTLLDGTDVRVRPISPEDKLLLASGLKLLSPETAFRRFLSPKTSFSAAELRYLTEVDQIDHVALVAVHAQWGGLIAVARSVRTGPDLAELAIVVGDPWQRLGLGRQLLDLVAERANVSRFSGTMLATNRGAVKLMRGFGSHVDRDVIDGGVREIVVRSSVPMREPVRVVAASLR